MLWRYVCVVALGGACGAACRYIISAFMVRYANELPWATIIVNVFGSLIAGFLLVAFSDKLAPTGLIRLFIFTGVLGAFTTFSAFSAENLEFFQNQQWLKLVANLGINNVGAFLGVLLGAQSAAHLYRG